MNTEVYNYSIRILSKRDYSSYKLKEKILSKSFNEEEAEDVIDKLIQKGFVNDKSYALMKAKSLILKGLSDIFVIKKLENESLFIESSDLNDLREEYNIDQESQIKKLIEKKMMYKLIPEDQESALKLKSKLINYLSSKGYSYEDVRQYLPSRLS